MKPSHIVKEELKRNNKKFAQLQFLAEAFYFEYPGADEPGFVWLESPIVWYKISVNSTMRLASM